MKQERIKMIRISNEFDKTLKILKAMVGAKTFADTFEFLADYFVRKENLNLKEFISKE